MFNLFKRNKKLILIDCKTDEIVVNGKTVNLPINLEGIISLFGKPNRIIEKSKTYAFWDTKGIQCSFNNEDTILSINFYQNKKDTSEYNTKKQFKGKLFLNDENITYKEFSRISLGNIILLRLGSENENRFGFSISVNEDYKNLK